MHIIYLDNNATTRVADEVIDAMTPFYREIYGNPHAVHQLGRKAYDAVESARRKVARLIGAESEEIIFTSCGTESNAMSLRGLLTGRRHFVSTNVEHPSVLTLLRELETEGEIDLTIIPVDSDGRLDLPSFERAITTRTALVSVMLAQNEIGVIYPVAEIAKLAHDRGALVHVDAVQAAGKIPIDVTDLGADVLTISGHKFHAPKGIGALYLRKGIDLHPLWRGGSQERGLRSGTGPVSLIVGMGVAAELAQRALPAQDCVRELRDRFERSLAGAGLEIRVHGRAAERLPNTSSISFRHALASDLIGAFDERGICVSPGAACHSGKSEASAVIKALSVPDEWALGTIRFSLSRYTTAAEIDRTVELITAALSQISR